MFEMTQSSNTDANSDIKDIKRLLDNILVSRGNNKFRRLYLMFYKLNFLLSEVFKGDYADELVINNVGTKQLYHYSPINFSQNDFRYILNEVTTDDLVLIIPPAPYEINDKEIAKESVQNSIKAKLQKNLQYFIEELDKKQTTFMMFYGRLDRPNIYPVFWQWGHVIYLSKIDDEKSNESLHHLFLSRNLAKLAMTPDYYGRSIQPLFYRIFEVQAAQNPNRIAVVSEKYNLTYKGLNEAANKLAHLLLTNGLDELRKKRTMRNKDCVIVIALDRDDPQLVIAKLAIEKMGATYTLLNTDSSRLPIENCIQRLINSNADFIITYNEYFQKIMTAPTSIYLKTQQALQLIEIFRDDIACNKIFMKLSGNIDDYSQNLNRNISPQHVLTHAYTSGSTGVPKAARIAARGYPFAAIAHIDAGRLEFGTNTLQFSSVDFDASQLEEKMTLAAGGKLVLMNQAAYSDHVKLMEILKKHTINCLTVTPNMLSLLLTHNQFPFISFCLVVGDAVNKELLDNLWDKLAIYKKPFYILVGYGTTQTTIQGTYLIYQKGKPITVGYPALGVNIELLSLNKLLNVANNHDHFTRKLIEDCGAVTLKPQDEENKAIEEGVICTYGPCNMLGYVGGETVAPDVLYNTKDIGYLSKSGMKIKGRIGRFFKINSQAGDLAEIETTLKEYKELVADCRAVIHIREVQNTKVNVLAVYIVPVDNKLIIKDASSPSRISLDALKELQSFMREKLQIWKVPALVNMLFVSELIVKNNDKMSFDDQAMCKKWKLPCIRLTGSNIFREQFSGLSSEAISFIKTTQRTAAECLNLLPTEIPLDVNFIDLGFDSLQIIHFIGRLKNIDLKAMGIHNDRFKRALDLLSIDNFKNIGTLLELYKHLQNSSNIIKRQSDDRDILIKRLPSKSLEKFMLRDFRIYNNESYGKIEETIWWIPSILGNAFIDYGASSILQLPLHNQFLECPYYKYIRQIQTLNELADYYISMMVSSHGFVFLGGWSSGGLLGKLIKEKLQKQGIKVILIMLDTVYPEKLQQMDDVEFSKEIHNIAKKIRASILLLLSLPESTFFNIASEDELMTIKSKEDKLLHLIGHVKASFALLNISNKQLDVNAVDKCITLIEYVDFFLKAEINQKTSFISELDESEILLCSEASVAKYGTNLGWKVNHDVQIEIIERTDHFSLLYDTQLVNLIKKRVIKELINLMEPYYQGLAYIISGKFKLAIECFNEVQLKNSGHPNFLYYRSKAYFNIENYDKSLADITQFINKFPDHFSALALQAFVLFLLERNVEAVEVYLKILQITNNVKEIRNIAPAISVVLLTGYCDNSFATHPSVKTLNEIVSSRPILRSYIYWVEVKHRLNTDKEVTKETLELINKSIDDDSENKEAYVTRAKINLQLAKYLEAKSDLDKAVSLEVKKESLSFHYGMICYYEDQFSEAVNLLSKAIDENDTNKGEAFHFRGLARVRLNQVDEAIQDLTSAYDLNNDIKSLIARANVYYGKNLFENAYYDFIKAIELGANNLMVFYKAALSAKEIIKVTKVNENIKRISQLYLEACNYLKKAINSIGDKISPLKTGIEKELANTIEALEAHKKIYDPEITRRVSDEPIPKKPVSVYPRNGIVLFKEANVQNQQKIDLGITAIRHSHPEEHTKASFTPTNQA